MRRLVAIATVALVVAALPMLAASFASAHDDHLEFKWREPSANADVSGRSVRIRARVRFEDYVDRWAVEGLAPEGDDTAAGFGYLCEGAGQRAKTVEVTCDWDTTVYPGGALSRNGRYRLRVTAWNAGSAEPDGTGDSGDNHGDSGDSGDSGDLGDSGRPDDRGMARPPPRAPDDTGGTDDPGQPGPPAGGPVAREPHTGPELVVTVANPPAPPRNIALSYRQETGRVTLTWDANREPDIVGYLVEERFEDGDWSLVAKPAYPSWNGRPTRKGTYRYRVAAIRRVGASGRVSTSVFEEPQSEPTRVVVQPGDTAAGGDATAGEAAPGEGGQRHAAGAESTTTTRADVGSVTVTYDGAAPPGRDPPGRDPSNRDPADRPAGHPPDPPAITPIAPGRPGSVETRYADPPALAAPVPPEQAFDPGFSMTLPYANDAHLRTPPPPEPPRLLGTVVLFETDEAQRRALVGALAGSLALFVASMQLVYFNRRPRLPDLTVLSDWD